MTAETEIMVGKYTSDGNYKILQLPAEVHHFQLWNYTQQSSAANPGVIKRAQWFLGMPTDYYMGVKNTDGAATDESVLGISGGFRWLDSSLQTLEASVAAITAITAATPAVVSEVAHGYSIGDTVQITGTTGMLQIAGMEFTITAVNANDFTLGYLPAVGFAAAATAGTARRLSTPPEFAPRRRFVTAITQAANAVVTMSVTHGYSAGERVKLVVPADFGMVEMNGLTGVIQSVDTTNNTITLDIDSSAFSAFAFPASGSVPFTFAQVVPVGDSGSVFSGAFRNDGYRALRIGATVNGALNDEIKWLAVRAGYRLIEA